MCCIMNDVMLSQKPGCDMNWRNPALFRCLAGCDITHCITLCPPPAHTPAFQDSKNGLDP